MNSKSASTNNSIQVTGGTLNANGIIAGDNARMIVNNAASTLAAMGRDDMRVKLDAVLDAIETHGAALPDRTTADQLVQKIAVETARKEPDKLNLKSFLQTLSDEVKSVSVIASAVAALVTSAKVLF